MLIQFAVENCLSFREKTVFSMRASKNVPRAENAADIARGTDILRCAALFGANAAGKSNFIKALRITRDLVLEGVKEGHDINAHPFQLSEDTRSAPTTLEVYLRANSGKIYGYGFVVTKKAVQREWLTEIRGNGEHLIFERVGQEFRFSSRGKTLSFLRSIQPGVRDNQLFLRMAKSLKIEGFPTPIQEVVGWFSTLQIIGPHSQYGLLIPELKGSNSFREFMGMILRQADTGIDGLNLSERRLGSSLEGIAKGRLDLLKIGDELIVMDTEQTRVGYRRDQDDWIELSLRFGHRAETGAAVELQLDEESDGTVRLLDLAPVLYYARSLENSIVFVIDELDRSLHTSLCRWLIERFIVDASGSTSQLIFTTHDTNLLDVQALQQDAFWFAEKKRDGRSTLYSLAEFKDEQVAKLRKDLEQAYLIGRFGGVPHLSGGRQK